MVVLDDHCSLGVHYSYLQFVVLFCYVELMLTQSELMTLKPWSARLCLELPDP